MFLQGFVISLNGYGRGLPTPPDGATSLPTIQVIRIDVKIQMVFLENTSPQIKLFLYPPK